MRFGEKAFPFSIELEGVDKLILSAARGNQEGQWDYAVWGNAHFVDLKGKSIWLDEIPFEYERTGRDSSPKMCVNDKGETIHVAGESYEHGVFCLAESILAYAINGKYVRFKAEIGVEDSSPIKGAVFFYASNIDMSIETKEIYRKYPEPIGALYAHSMQQGENMESLLSRPDISIEKAIVKDLIGKLKGNLSQYQQKLRKAENTIELKTQLISYLTLFEQLRKDYKLQLARESNFSFAFLTDVHLYENNNRGSADGFKRALEQVKFQDVDFLLFGGDNAPIDHYNPGDEKALKLMKEFKTMVNQTGYKAYYTAGNHDFVFKDGSIDEKSLDIYEKEFGPAYYSFNHKGVHFIILNSNEQDGEGVYRLSEEQIEWLKEDLKATGTTTPIIFSMHVPMLSLYYPSMDGRYITNNDMFSNYKDVWDLLRDYNVGLILQGHQHLYEEILSRKTQFITGGAVCDNWWLGGGFGDTFSGYLIVSVGHENDFSWEYICF